MSPRLEISAPERDRAIALRKQGVGTAKIAAALGLSRNSVRQLFKREGVAAPKRATMEHRQPARWKCQLTGWHAHDRERPRAPVSLPRLRFLETDDATEARESARV